MTFFDKVLFARFTSAYPAEDEGSASAIADSMFAWKVSGFRSEYIFRMHS
jgi:hypothetical protein